MQKIDRTTYSQRDTERIPRILEYKPEAGGVSYKVHRHLDNPDTWFLTCRGFCDMVDLHTDDFVEAEKKAASYMRKLAKRKIQEFATLIEDIEKSFEIS